jgi:hypothetical protein
MKRHFTHYWTNKTWDFSRHCEGELLNHTAGNMFLKRGVSAGDSVYAVTVHRGRLFLLGRLCVAAICGQDEAARRLNEGNLWRAKEHVIASSGTPERFEFEVPLSVTKQLLFVADGPGKPPVFSAPGYLDQQTLRGVRELEPASARLLDELLPTDTPIPARKKGRSLST